MRGVAAMINRLIVARFIHRGDRYPDGVLVTGYAEGGRVSGMACYPVGEQGGKAMTFDSRAAPARLDALIVRLKRQHELISVVFNINISTMYRFYGFTIVAEKVGSFYRLGLTID